jgi:hypothetical protein
LWFWPLVGVILTAAAVIALTPMWTTLQLWSALLVKLLIATVLYTGILWVTEKRQLLAGWQMIWGLLRSLLNAADLKR